MDYLLDLYTGRLTNIYGHDMSLELFVKKSLCSWKKMLFEIHISIIFYLPLVVKWTHRQVCINPRKIKSRKSFSVEINRSMHKNVIPKHLSLLRTLIATIFCKWIRHNRSRKDGSHWQFPNTTMSVRFLPLLSLNFVTLSLLMITR